MKCKCGGEITEYHTYWNKCTKCGELYDLKDMTEKAEALTEFKEAVEKIHSKKFKDRQEGRYWKVYEIGKLIHTKTEGGEQCE